MANLEIIDLLERVRAAVGITRVEFAERLGVTMPFLLQLESGRRLPPPEFIQRIVATFQPTPDIVAALEGITEGGRKVIRIPFAPLDATRRRLAMKFARYLLTLTPQDMQEIMEVLEPPQEIEDEEDECEQKRATG